MNVFRLHIFTGTGVYVKYKLSTTTHFCMPGVLDYNASIAVIDSQNILITPFMKKTIPPPMSLHKIACLSAVNNIVWSNYNMDLLALLANGDLAYFKYQKSFVNEKNIEKESYTLNGQMIQIDDEKKTVGFILGESSNCGENIKGLYIFHETEKKSYEIYSGELKGSKKTGDKGLTIKFEENSTSRKVEAMISLINYGETADPILLYKENEYAVNVCKSSADQKLYTGVLKFSNEKESVFYGEIELNQEKKFIIGKEGILYLDNHVYKGEFKDNKKHGEGLYYILNENKEDTLILDAVFENDNIKYGFLYKELSDKTKVNVFKGEFNNNKPFKGIYSYPEGDQYEGELNDNGERNGNGKYTYKKDYSVYDGEWLKNLKDGIGEYKGVKYIWKDDQIIKKI